MYASLIRQRRLALGLRQEELAARVGVSRNTVAGWETGHSRPGLDTLPALCDALHISLNRFFGRESAKTAREKEVLDKFFALEPADREVIEWQMEALFERRAEQFREDALKNVIRVYASDLGAAAGFGAALGEAQGEMIYLLRTPLTEQADEVITVCGDSMEPTYSDGEQVLVRHTKELRPGDIGIFLVDNEGYIKEYQKDGLHSHNPAYRVMTFRGDQRVRCVGRVIGKVTEDEVPTPRQIRIVEEAAAAGRRERI